jgi:hypothetical protein
MIDAVKDYLAPKRFGVVAYVCLIVHFLCGLAFTAVTSALRAGEIGKFSCTIGTKSSRAQQCTRFTSKKHVILDTTRLITLLYLCTALFY